MVNSDLGTWAPLEIDAVVEIFSPARFRWWISGGRALELHLGRSWRDHDDIDVGVLRCELDSVHSLLAGWDLQVAAEGRLTPWSGELLDASLHQNGLWCRARPGGPWVLDMVVNEGSESGWIFRRDPSVQQSWDHAVLWTADGVPYLAPELQLLFKSKDPRPKDDVDAAQVIPALGHRHRRQLGRLLAPDHPWRHLLE